MEEQFKIRICIKSPTLIGSGEGFGALIDSDIVFDDVGIPYIPAKRIKGCLRDTAEEVKEMLKSARISYEMDIEAVFGQSGSIKPARVYFSNLFIPEYEAERAWLLYFMGNKNFGTYIHRESIQQHFTEVRQLTQIEEDGVASDHSLRSVRVVKKGESFEGDVRVVGKTNSDSLIQILYLACLNFRRMGTGRNRGFGEIACTLDTEDRKLNMPETLCIR